MFVVPDGLVVFSKDNCAGCVQLKRKLESQDKPYFEYKIDENQEAANFVISKGFRSMPVVFLDGEAVSVFKVVS